MSEISISGEKYDAVQQLIAQVPFGAQRTALQTLIEKGPGTHISISGSIEEDANRSHGRISIIGSFWTPTPTR